MKKLFKVFGLLVVILSLTCLVACKDKEETVKTKNNPFVSNGDEVLASLTENGITYKATKGQAYMDLKVSNGADTLINLVDEYLLKNKVEKDYLALVSDEDLKAAIDKDCYGSEEDLTDGEKQEKVEEYLDKMFVSLNIKATDIYDSKIKDTYRLSLAEKAYAKDVLIKKAEETDAKYAEYQALSDEEKAKATDPVTAPYFAESKVQAKYEKDHINNYSAIIVTFPTMRLANIALQAIGVNVSDGVWKNDAGAELTNQEVLDKYIELYNYSYGYKGLTLDKDSEEFDFTETELNAVNPTTATRIKDKMVSFGEEGIWYYAEPFETASGSLFVYVLKIDETLDKAYEDLTDEEKAAEKAKYLDDLYEDALTTTYIGGRMADLRTENNLVIYDTVIEKDYESAISTYSIEFKTTDVEKKDIVASIDGKDFTCDELCEKMLAKLAMATLTEILANERFLNNPDLNPYYQNGSWVDSAKKADLEQLIEAEKTNFKNGTYSSYGYDATTTSWQTFMEASYSVRNDDELLMYFLTDAVATLYTSKLNYLVNKTNEEYDFTVDEASQSNLWNQVSASMQKLVDEYYSVKGIHLLIASYESTTAYVSGASPVDSKDWTDEQNAEAVNLANEVMAYIHEETGTYQSRFEKIVDAFKAAPSKVGDYTFADKDVKTTLVSENGNATINVSKYKGYGLYVKFENLNSFTNGSMVEEFDNAVKEIYDAQLKLGNFGDDSLVVVCETPIKTKFGYHVYVNLTVTEPKYATRELNDEDQAPGSEEPKYTYRFLPTIEEIRKYTANNSDSSLTSNVKTAITTYYKNIATELTGDHFTLAMRYNELKGLTLSSSVINTEDFNRYLDYYTDFIIDSNLTYVTADYLE